MTGMTEADVARVERELGVTLPAAYRAALVDPPFEELRDDPVYWFFVDADAIIGETRHPLADTDHDDPDQMRGRVAIGHSACGDTYLLDTAEPDGPVYYLSHETHEVAEDYPSFAAFVRAYAVDYPAETAARLAAEAAARRAWWRRYWRVTAAALALPALAWAVLALLVLALRGCD